MESSPYTTPGRAPHVNVMVHGRGAQALRNGTLQDGVAAHAGQLFFGQELVVCCHELG